MSTSFYLVRHGIKEKGIGDAALSPKGVWQAQATAQYFRTLPVKAVVSSPLRRAKETAACIAEETGLTVLEDIRLRERANWGDSPEQTFAEFVAMWERCTRDREYMPPVGDSAWQAGQRLALVVTELAENHPESELIFVTHGGLITDFLVNIFSEDRLNEWHPTFLTSQSSLIPECSITKVSYAKGEYDMTCFASVRHLERERVS